MTAGPEVSQILGPNYNLIGFDPRGVNNSGPTVDCFPNDPNARSIFKDLFFSDTSNSSSNSLEKQYYAADLFGQWCSESFRKNASGQYVGTPAVAKDMLSYVKAEQSAAGKAEEDAKLWYYAVSYGTALGSTFAALFPNNVGRLVLDGVLDAQDYYNLGWKTNLYQTDEALGTFSTYCHQGGPKNCSFWGPSAQNITDRLNSILFKLQDNPIPVSGLNAGTPTGLATFADLKQMMLQAVYAPVQRFPPLADALLALENGDGSQVIGGISSVNDAHDVEIVIKCVDGYHRTNLSSLEAFEHYVTLLEGQSKYFGDAWPTNSNNVLCRSLKLSTSDTRSFSGALLS